MSFTDDDAQRLLATEAEQGRMTAEDTAGTLVAFRKTLVEGGFESADVSELCKDFFAAILDRWSAQPDEED